MRGGASVAPIVASMAHGPGGIPVQMAKAPTASPPPMKKLKTDVLERPPDATVVLFDKKYL